MAVVEEVPVKQPEKSGKGKGLIIGIVIFVIVALIASGVSVMLVMMHKGEKAPKVEKPKPGILVPLSGEIIVNLAEAGGRRYLKVNAALEVDSEKTAVEVGLRMAQIRDLIIVILRQKTVEKISEKEGIDKVRSEIIAGINRCLSEGRVSNLYFTDFVVQ